MDNLQVEQPQNYKNNFKKKTTRALEKVIYLLITIAAIKTEGFEYPPPLFLLM